MLLKSKRRLSEIDTLLDDILGARSGVDFAQMPFEDFCADYLRIQDKNGELVPLVLNHVQRHLIGALTGRDIVLKARQVGISTVLQAWHYYSALCANVRTSTLCHEDELTSELRLMTDRFHDNMPDAQRPRRKYANAAMTTYPELESQARIATVGGHSGAGSAGKRKGRGGSNTHIHGSEVAFWPDADGVMSAAMQAGNPDIVLESTPNGMVGWFYERCMEALDDADSVWTLHFYPWWWDDGYAIALDAGETLRYSADEQALVDTHNLTPEQIKWRRKKQKELPHTFEQEYPEDPRTCFLASGESYFRDVEHVFTAPLQVKPIEGRKYVGGLDFAQTNDYLCLIILDSETLQQVDMLHINKLAWQDMRRRISEMCHKWNDAEIVAEANAAGSTNIELLRTGEIMPDGTRTRPVQLRSFDTTPKSKPPLIQGLYYALHEGGLTLQDRGVTRHELRAFISKQLPSGAWQYAAGGGAHDDTVIALALAWHGITQAAYHWPDKY